MKDFIVIEEGKIPRSNPCFNCDSTLLSDCELKHKGKAGEFFGWRMFKNFQEFQKLKDSPIYKCFFGAWVIAYNCKQEDFLTLKERVKLMGSKKTGIEKLIRVNPSREVVKVTVYQSWRSYSNRVYDST